MEEAKSKMNFVDYNYDFADNEQSKQYNAQRHKLMDQIQLQYIAKYKKQIDDNYLYTNEFVVKLAPRMLSEDVASVWGKDADDQMTYENGIIKSLIIDSAELVMQQLNKMLPNDVDHVLSSDLFSFSLDRQSFMVVSQVNHDLGLLQWSTSHRLMTFVTVTLKRWIEQNFDKEHLIVRYAVLDMMYRSVVVLAAEIVQQLDVLQTDLVGRVDVSYFAAAMLCEFVSNMPWCITFTLGDITFSSPDKNLNFMEMLKGEDNRKRPAIFNLYVLWYKLSALRDYIKNLVTLESEIELVWKQNRVWTSHDSFISAVKENFLYFFGDSLRFATLESMSSYVSQKRLTPSK